MINGSFPERNTLLKVNRYFNMYEYLGFDTLLQNCGKALNTKWPTDPILLSPENIAFFCVVYIISQQKFRLRSATENKLMRSDNSSKHGNYRYS